MSTSTRQKKAVKTILFVVESTRCSWRDDTWHILTPVRPSPDKAKVLARLEKYRAARGVYGNYTKYRVTPFVQDVAGAVELKKERS